MKALNVHISPSIIVQESRLYKVTSTLIEQRFVKQIMIVGKSGPNFPFQSQIDKERTIKRFPISQARGSLLSRSLRFIIWSLRVFRRFRSDKIDLVNCHSYSVLPLCLTLKIWRQAILIYDQHDLETETSPCL